MTNGFYVTPQLISILKSNKYVQTLGISASEMLVLRLNNSITILQLPAVCDVTPR